MTNTAELRTELDRLWEQIKQHPELHEKGQHIISLYRKHEEQQKLICLQYEFHILLGLDPPPTPTGLWKPQSWHDDQLGTGVISDLSRTLADGESISIHLRRAGEQLQVIIEPHPYQGETRNTTKPVVVYGSPRNLDHELAIHLPKFVQSRQIVREALEQYAEEIKAETLKMSLPKEETTLNMEFQEMINLTQTVVRVRNARGTRVYSADSFPRHLSAGQATIDILSPDHEPYTTVVKLHAGEEHTLNPQLFQKE